MIVDGKNAEGLVAHAQRALEEHWWYVWGTIGEPLTKSKLDWCVKTYPTRNSYEMHSPHLGEMVSDCVGLIKSYCMWDDSKDKMVYAASMDKNTGGMYTLATVKGSIGTIPEKPGVCVYKQGHVGIYAGNGKVIECAWKQGVIETPLKGQGATPWTNWFECPFISYKEPEKPQDKFSGKVRVIKDATDYNGRRLAGWVYNRSFDVVEHKGDRVVIGFNGRTTAAVNEKDVIWEE